MKCLKCGNELKDTAKFCAFCGCKVEAMPAEEEKVQEIAETAETPAAEPVMEVREEPVQPAEIVSTPEEIPVMQEKKIEEKPAYEAAAPVEKPAEEKFAAENDIKAEPVKTVPEIKAPKPAENRTEDVPLKADSKLLLKNSREEQTHTYVKARRTGLGKGVAAAAVITIVLVAGAAVAYPTLIKPTIAYNEASAAMDGGRYADAYNAFLELGDFKDSSSKASAAIYLDGKQKMDSGDYAGAIAAFSTYTFPNFKSAITQCSYKMAEQKLAEGDYAGAAADFLALADYNDSADRYVETVFTHADALAAEGDFTGAKSALEAVSDKSFGEATAADKIKEYGYLELCAEIDGGTADEDDLRTLMAMEGYMDSAERFTQLCTSLAESYMNSEDYVSAAAMFLNTDESALKVRDCLYKEASKRLANGDKDSARNLFAAVGTYQDSVMKKNELAREPMAPHNTWNAECYTYTGDFATTRFKAGETITVSGKAGNETSPAAAAIYVIRITGSGLSGAESVSGMRRGAEFSVDFETTAESVGTAEVSVMLAETGAVLYKFNIEIV